MKNIYLIGFMGVGKTTLGRKLARKLEFEFIDLDHIFEEKYKIRIDDFFGKYDEELFRKLEHEILLETFNAQNTVISTGGGSACFYDAIDKINNKGGTSVYLFMHPAAIANRLTHAKKPRPLIKNKSGDELKEVIQQKLEARKQHYEKAHYKVSALHITPDELVNLLQTSK